MGTNLPWLLHHNLIVVQAKRQLAIEPRIGQNVGVKNRHIFAIRPTNRSCQETRVSLPMNPCAHQLAKLIVRRVQETRVLVACASEVEQRCTAGHHVDLTLGDDHLPLIPGITEQTLVPVVSADS